MDRIFHSHILISYFCYNPTLFPPHHFSPSIFLFSIFFHPLSLISSPAHGPSFSPVSPLLSSPPLLLLSSFPLLLSSSALLLHASFPPSLSPGYGHTAPLSDGGKAFCIVYSVIGIPFTLLFLTAVVQRIMVFSTRRPVMYVHTRWGVSKPLVAAVHAALLAVLAASCFFLIPAAIFSALEENWNFLESFYFCFISLSTIGLGDYVPGEAFNQRFRELYKVGITGESASRLSVIRGVDVKYVRIQSFLRDGWYISRVLESSRLNTQGAGADLPVRQSRQLPGAP